MQQGKYGPFKFYAKFYPKYDKNGHQIDQCFSTSHLDLATHLIMSGFECFITSTQASSFMVYNFCGVDEEFKEYADCFIYAEEDQLDASEIIHISKHLKTKIITEFLNQRHDLKVASDDYKNNKYEV